MLQTLYKNGGLQMTVKWQPDVGRKSERPQENWLKQATKDVGEKDLENDDCRDKEMRQTVLSCDDDDLQQLHLLQI